MDILNIQPHVVSRNLRGYIVLFYGEKKSGKTTNAAEFPSPLLCAFEKGYNALEGVMAANIQKWSDFKKILKQLKSEEAQAMYQTIIIDTSDIAYELCEEYIFKQESVDGYAEIPYGGGYAMVSKEFDRALREIPLMGYGLVIISHATEKTFTDKNNEEYTKITTTMPKKCANLTSRMADIIGYAAPIGGEEDQTVLYMRGTKYFEAGSRFKHTPSSIIFSYDNLVGAIHDAVEKQEAAVGRESVEETQNLYGMREAELDFNELQRQFKIKVDDILEKLGGEAGGPKIRSVVEKHLGKGKRVDSMLPDQVDILDLIVDDLSDI